MSPYDVRPKQPMTEEERSVFLRLKDVNKYYSPKELRCSYEVLESLAMKGYLVTRTAMVQNDIFDAKRHLRFRKRHLM